MLFIPTYQRMDSFRCAVCDLGTGPGDELDEDDEGVPYPPLGWARVTIEQVEVNPDYQDAMSARDVQIQAQVQVALGQAQGTPTDEEIANVRAFLDAQAAYPDLPEFVAVSTVVALCSQHVGDLAKLGLEIAAPEPEPPAIDLGGGP